MSETGLEARYESIEGKKFVGKRVTMSFAVNKTSNLWREFMPRKSEIATAVGPELYSIEVYPKAFFERFDPAAAFEKWAAVEVSADEDVPADLETLEVRGGLYAVFIYRGRPSEAAPFYQDIFMNWLPNSDLLLDERPHLAVMGEKYKRDADDSEEEIWIPVKSGAKG